MLNFGTKFAGTWIVFLQIRAKRSALPLRPRPFVILTILMSLACAEATLDESAALQSAVFPPEPEPFFHAEYSDEELISLFQEEHFAGDEPLQYSFDAEGREDINNLGSLYRPSDIAEEEWETYSLERQREIHGHHLFATYVLRDTSPSAQNKKVINPSKARAWMHSSLSSKGREVDDVNEGPLSGQVYEIKLASYVQTLAKLFEYADYLSELLEMRFHFHTTLLRSYVKKNPQLFFSTVRLANALMVRVYSNNNALDALSAIRGLFFQPWEHRHVAQAHWRIENSDNMPLSFHNKFVGFKSPNWLSSTRYSIELRAGDYEAQKNMMLLITGYIENPALAFRTGPQGEFLSPKLFTPKYFPTKRSQYQGYARNEDLAKLHMYVPANYGTVLEDLILTHSGLEFLPEYRSRFRRWIGSASRAAPLFSHPAETHTSILARWHVPFIHWETYPGIEAFQAEIQQARKTYAKTLTAIYVRGATAKKKSSASKAGSKREVSDAFSIALRRWAYSLRHIWDHL